MNKYICNFSGCNELLDERGYCWKHIQYAPVRREHKPFENAERSNKWYNTSRWRKLRLEVLQFYNYQCSKCGKSKEDGAVLEIHHLIPPRGNEELFFRITNLIPVCRECHRILTANEINERKNG